MLYNVCMNLRNARRILIVGGTFDPPHAAHLIQPRLVAERIGADAMVYIPTGRSPHKPVDQTSPAHRLAMLRLMVAGIPDIRVLTLEIDRLDNGRPSFTLDTLQALRQQFGPLTQGGPELRLLMGCDQAVAFHTWHEPQQIIELAEPVVMTRPPLSASLLMDQLCKVQPPEQASQWASRIVELPMLEISSTDIRQRVREGRSITGLVTPAVEDYIRQHGLYRGG